MRKVANQNSENGYVAISIILLLSVVLLGIIMTVTGLGIGEGQLSLARSKGENTLFFVEGCMEDALLKLRADGNYGIGGSVIARPEGTCTITTVSNGNNNYTLTATTTDPSYVRKIQVIVNRDYSITLTSWQEI